MVPEPFQPFLTIVLILILLSTVFSEASLRWTYARNGHPQLATVEGRRVQRRTLLAVGYPLFAGLVISDAKRRLGPDGAVPAFVAAALGTIVWVFLLRAAKPPRPIDEG